MVEVVNNVGAKVRCLTLTSSVALASCHSLSCNLPVCEEWLHLNGLSLASQISISHPQSTFTGGGGASIRNHLGHW